MTPGDLPLIVDVRRGPQPTGRGAHVQIQCTCGCLCADVFVCPRCLSPLSRTGTRVTSDAACFRRGDEVIVPEGEM